MCRKAPKAVAIETTAPVITNIAAERQREMYRDPATVAPSLLLLKECVWSKRDLGQYEAAALRWTMSIGAALAGRVGRSVRQRSRTAAVVRTRKRWRMTTPSHRKGAEALSGARDGALPRRLVGSVLLGTLLNPLNSSMIAVALVTLGTDFRVGAATATWLISGFYLAAAVGMPVQGRLADRYGARRVFLSGLLLVGLTGALAALAPSFQWLLACRVLQAFGTAAAYPAGLAIFRAAAPDGRPPVQALGALSIASSVSAAIGPVLGGLLIALAGWPAIFWINLPVVAVGLVLAGRWLPPDRRRTPADGARLTGRATLAATLLSLDLPGVALFAATLAALLGFLLTLTDRPVWPLLPVAGVAAALLFVRERRAAAPFLDIRLLAANPRLMGVFAQFGAINVVFYAVFFGLPLWLEQARRFPPAAAGVLLLPLAGIGVLATPLAARLIDRRGARPALVIGAAALLAGVLLLLRFDAGTSVPALLAVGAVLGIPNAFNNLGLQAALYRAAPTGQMGTAGGQFQTFRYIGAILATALLGVAFGGQATTPALHAVAIFLAGLSTFLLIAALRSDRVTAGQRRARER
jgi:MFS family permease